MSVEAISEEYYFNRTDQLMWHVKSLHHINMWHMRFVHFGSNCKRLPIEDKFKFPWPFKGY